jgi:hypothetical protein
MSTTFKRVIPLFAKNVSCLENLILNCLDIFEDSGLIKTILEWVIPIFKTLERFHRYFTLRYKFGMQLLGIPTVDVLFIYFVITLKNLGIEICYRVLTVAQKGHVFSELWQLSSMEPIWIQFGMELQRSWPIGLDIDSNYVDGWFNICIALPVTKW